MRVRCPASSANLGSGFDTLGLALALTNEVDAGLIDDGVRVSVVGEGRGSLAEDSENLVARSAAAALDRLGWHPPGLRLACRNAIPNARGLGSSAAAIVAGVSVAYALAHPDAEIDRAWVLAVAAAIEGHPDNVAACVLGGATVSWCDDDGSARAVRVEPAEGLAATVLVPEQLGSTSVARGLLPLTVPHADAAHAAGRAALLVAAITGRPDLLLAATEDRLHQPYRAGAMPATSALVHGLRAEGWPATVSGAGPAVLVLHATDAGSTHPVGDLERVIDDLLDDQAPGWRAIRLDLDRAGVRVEPVGSPSRTRVPG